MSAEASSEVLRLDAVELVRRLKARELSCAALMEATLKRIDALNPTFNAIVALRGRDELFAEAKAKDSAPAGGALFGLPLAVKDLAAARGMRMTMGSPLLERFVPSEDSIFVERLRAAGAILIGKTNTPEFGLGSQTLQSRPWRDPQRVRSRAHRRRLERRRGGRARAQDGRARRTAPTTAAACATPPDGTTSTACVRRSGVFRATGGKPGCLRWASTDRWPAIPSTSRSCSR